MRQVERIIEEVGKHAGFETVEDMQQRQADEADALLIKELTALSGTRLAGRSVSWLSVSVQALEDELRTVISLSASNSCLDVILLITMLRLRGVSDSTINETIRSVPGAVPIGPSALLGTRTRS